MFTHTISKFYKDSAGATVQAVLPIQADNENNVSKSCPDAMTTEIDVTWTQLNLKSISFFSDKALTLHTNTSSPGVDIIVLTAGVAQMWSLVGDGATTCPFTVDVTKIFAINASGGAAALEIRSLVAN